MSLIGYIINRNRVPGRRTWTHTSFCREFIILPYVLFVKISYQARFCLQISYHASLFTMLIGFLNCGSFIIRALLPGTSTACTLSVFLLAACVHVLLPGTRRHIVRSDNLGNDIISFMELKSQRVKPHNFDNLAITILTWLVQLRSCTHTKSQILITFDSLRRFTSNGTISVINLREQVICFSLHKNHWVKYC